MTFTPHAIVPALLVPGTERVDGTSLRYLASSGEELMLRWQVLVIAAAAGAMH